MPALAANDLQILLLEMQTPIVDASTTVAPMRLRSASAALIEIAALVNIPVTVSIVPLSEETPRVIEELASVEPLVRSAITPFGDISIADRLKRARRNTIILGGVSSEIAILHTTLAALDAGFAVHLLSDLCGGLDPRTDRASVERMWRAGAVPSSLSSFATALVDDMNSEPGGAIMRALGNYWGWSDHDDPAMHAPHPPIERDVQALLDELIEAWSEGDAERFARSFASDARFVAFDGSALHGPVQIADYHRGPFETHLAETRLTFGPAEITSVGRCAWTVATEGGIARGGQTEGELIGRSAQTFVLERAHGRLQVAAFQNTRIRPMDSPAAAAAWRRFDEDWAKSGTMTSEHNGASQNEGESR